MALNLNKEDEENSKPPSEKKGLKLSKLGDAPKTVLNLKKEGSDTKEATYVNNRANESGPKKKNPVIFILLAVLIVSSGLFWFLNKRTTTPPKTSNTSENNEVSSAPVQINQSTTPDNNANNQGQNNSVNPSTATSPENSVSNSPVINVSASSNNINNSSNLETSSSIPIKKQTATNTSSPSAITVGGSIDEKVNQVLRGDFGNGLERKQALGEEYVIIQAKVNEFYRNKNN